VSSEQLSLCLSVSLSLYHLLSIKQRIPVNIHRLVAVVGVQAVEELVDLAGLHGRFVNDEGEVLAGVGHPLLKVLAVEEKEETRLLLKRPAVRFA
jgi:hypothetical protein